MPRHIKPSGKEARSMAITAMRAQDYDACPPVCASCKHVRQKLGQAPKCAIGTFYVRLGGICDRWTDKATGERLNG